VTAVRIIGPGRAGTSLALALTNVGWDVAPMLGRHDALADAAVGVQLLVLATPDDVIATVAEQVQPVPTTVVAHLSGSRGLAELGEHPRKAAFHPLVSLPTPDVGAKRLIGAWYAVAGDVMADKVVAALGGRAFAVDDDDRAAYHAAAAIASNHLVALLGQVHRLADRVDVPFEAYLDLARSTLDNVVAMGPHKALTGPAARGDESTLRRHLRALPAEERKAYRGMVDAARRLAAEARGSVDEPRDAAIDEAEAAEAAAARAKGRPTDVDPTDVDGPLGEPADVPADAVAEAPAAPAAVPEAPAADTADTSGAAPATDSTP
jgi:predicted short-subunit dehydrogenase-like oxidoreductase (DUF2520 family)